MTRTRPPDGDDPPPRAAARRRGLAGVVVPLVLVAGAGCAPEDAPAPPGQASPFADCATLSVPPPSAASTSSSASAGGSGAASDPGAGLPDLELPCFTGGQPVRLTSVRGPAVINMWASWCAPCRAELPIMQRLADRADGRLHVLGVDVGDGRDAAASFAAGRQVTMPTLYDRDRRLPASLGRGALPITIFVDPAGRDYVHPMPLDAAGLASLVRKHTGVAVTP